MSPMSTIALHPSASIPADAEGLVLDVILRPDFASRRNRPEGVEYPIPDDTEALVWAVHDGALNHFPRVTARVPWDDGTLPELPVDYEVQPDGTTIFRLRHGGQVFLSIKPARRAKSQEKKMIIIDPTIVRNPVAVHPDGQLKPHIGLKQLFAIGYRALQVMCRDGAPHHLGHEPFCRVAAMAAFFSEVKTVIVDARTVQLVPVGTSNAPMDRFAVGRTECMAVGRRLVGAVVFQRPDQNGKAQPPFFSSFEAWRRTDDAEMLRHAMNPGHLCRFTDRLGDLQPGMELRRPDFLGQIVRRKTDGRIDVWRPKGRDGKSHEPVGTVIMTADEVWDTIRQWADYHLNKEGSIWIG